LVCAVLVDSVTSLIGNTPLVRLSRIVPEGSANIYVKLEYLNPTGSHKDRIALYMIKDAVSRGLIKPGDYVIEASSGNTAISVAWLASLLGFKSLIVVNENVSPSKLDMIRALGAEVILAPNVPAEHPESKYSIAMKISRERGILYLNQMANEANFLAHYETTAREIYRDLNGNIDVFVMGIGTCGTLAGVGKFLKERLGNKVKVVGVVPKGSVVLHPNQVLRDYIEGLTSEKVPELFIKYRGVIDDVIEVSYEDAMRTLAKLIKYEGILGGPSTGANVYASIKLAQELGGGKNVVTLAPDTIFKYPQVLSEVVRGRPPP